MKTHYQTTLHNNAGTLSTGEPAPRLAAVCHSRWNGDAAVSDFAQTLANAERLKDCWNACHGLDLPVNVSPGALAEIVTAARALLEAYDLRGYGCGDEAQALEDTLAKLDPPPAEPKPYAYAVKTAEGYVANQGPQWWHESEPVGWALFGTREGAESIAGLRGGEVVPVFKR
jgi:hypothetical protein